jgi:hypothetical protein
MPFDVSSFYQHTGSLKNELPRRIFHKTSYGKPEEFGRSLNKRLATVSRIDHSEGMMKLF